MKSAGIGAWMILSIALVQGSSHSLGSETEVRPGQLPDGSVIKRILITHPDQVFTRQALLDRVWGPAAYVEDRTVDVHIRWLREKIEVNPSQPLKLLTVRGVGYKFSSN